MTQATYPPFNAGAVCVKCLGEDVAATYVAPCSDPACRMEKCRERIDRLCRRCRFAWREAPLDAEVVR